MGEINFNKKRWEVINRFPTSSDPIGTILTEGDYNFDLDAYPNLYRLLNWWEHRCPEQMPALVKKISENDGYHVKGDFLKVEQWIYNKYVKEPNKDKCLWLAKIGMHYYNANVLVPVTQSEYDAAPDEHKPTT